MPSTSGRARTLGELRQLNLGAVSFSRICNGPLVKFLLTCRGGGTFALGES